MSILQYLRYFVYFYTFLHHRNISISYKCIKMHSEPVTQINSVEAKLEKQKQNSKIQFSIEKSPNTICRSPYLLYLVKLNEITRRKSGVHVARKPREHGGWK